MLEYNMTYWPPECATPSRKKPFDRLYELMSVYAEFRHMLVEAPEELFV
jgi:hypothetical protein